MFGLSGLDPTLQQPRLGWIRFCARLDAEVELEEGFLNDPGGTWGRLANPNALSLADLASEPCVVLLGEPGLGKTIALEQEEARLRAAGGTVDRIDLRGYDTGTDLGTRMFRSQCWQEWQKGSYQLTLILDAVDESPLPSNTLVRVVLDGLRTADLTRLVLRIACRHGAWPPAFEQGLADRFGRTPRELLYKLLPLRMADVKEAATHRGFDGDGFVAEVVRRGVGPLASIPITLDMLLRIYAEGQTLPLEDFAEFAPIARRIAEHEQRDRIVALLLRRYFQAPPPEAEEDDTADTPMPPRPRRDGGFRSRRRR